MPDRWLGDDLDDDVSLGTAGLRLDTEDRDATLLKNSLLTVFRSPGYSPPVLPKVALELTELTRRPEVNLADVSRLLSQDPLIAASVLKYAQSPIYSRGVPIQSLHDAIIRLGLLTVRDIFFEALAAARVFRVPGYDAPMERLRLHSAATAHIARLVCRHARLRDDHAFLCGLLHDAGIVAAIIALASTHAKGAPLPDFAKVWPTIASIHEEAGATLCRIWGLPDVALVIATHHGPRGGPVQRLAALTRVAELVASDMGLGMDESDEGHGWAVDALGLSAGSMATIANDAKELLRRGAG